MDLAGGYITMFSDENYRAILYGMNHYPNLHMPSNPNENAKIYQEFDNRVTQVSNLVMSHQDYLQNLHR